MNNQRRRVHLEVLEDRQVLSGNPLLSLAGLPTPETLLVGRHPDRTPLSVLAVSEGKASMENDAPAAGLSAKVHLAATIGLTPGAQLDAAIQEEVPQLPVLSVAARATIETTTVVQHVESTSQENAPVAVTTPISTPNVPNVPTSIALILAGQQNAAPQLPFAYPDAGSNPWLGFSAFPAPLPGGSLTPFAVPLAPTTIETTTAPGAQRIAETGAVSAAESAPEGESLSADPGGTSQQPGNVPSSGESMGLATDFIPSGMDDFDGTYRQLFDYLASSGAAVAQRFSPAELALLLMAAATAGAGYAYYRQRSRAFVPVSGGPLDTRSWVSRLGVTVADA